MGHRAPVEQFWRTVIEPVRCFLRLIMSASVCHTINMLLIQ